jgi:hypothetical protein
MEYLTTAAVIIIVTLVIKGIHDTAKKTPYMAAPNAMVLKYHRAIAIVGYVVIGFGFSMGIVTIFQLIPTTGDEVLPYLVSFFVLLGLPLILMEKNIRVTVTDELVRYTGITKKSVEVRWDQVRRVTFSVLSQIVLHSDTAQVKLNTELEGLDAFIEKMKQKLEPSLYEKAIEEMEKAVKNMKKK